MPSSSGSLRLSHSNSSCRPFNPLPDVSKPNCNGLNRVQFPATASDLCGRTLLRFAEETLLIEPVLNRISRECLNGHPVLIPEAAGILEDQLEALKTFCAEFNRIAEGRQECAIILRDSLRSQACAAVLPS